MRQEMLAAHLLYPSERETGADAGKALAQKQGGLAVLIAQSNGQVWKSPAMGRQLGAA